MDLDDEICCCYHVSMRKLVNFARRNRPQRASEMTQCLGAGTGCGWCIPVLRKIAMDPDTHELEGMTPEEYLEKRRVYRASGQSKHTFQDDS
jgi:NAD(P)H-nitrite reductase large subunit